MAKDKQQKKKERERRVAKEKHAAAAERRAKAKESDASAKPGSKTARVMGRPVTPQAPQNNTAAKTNFSQRRMGGG